MTSWKWNKTVMNVWTVIGLLVVFAIGAWIAKNTTWLNAVPGL